MSTPGTDLATGSSVRPATRPGWHGRASVYGVMAGMLVAAAGYVGFGLGHVLGPLLVPLTGAALLRRPGRGRQFGVGLLASTMVVPMIVLSLLLTQVVDSALG